MNPIRVRIESIVTGVFLALSLVLLFDGLLYQIGDLLFQKYILKPIYIKIILFSGILLFIIYTRKFKLPYLIVIIFTSSLAVNLFVNSNNAIVGYNLYYSGIILFFLLAILSKKLILYRLRYRVLLTLAICVAIIIGVFQGAGINIFSYSENSENSILQSRSIYGMDRVYSVFSSGLNFGYVSIVAFIWILSAKNLRFKSFILLILLICIYLSYTRTIYIMLLLTLIGVSLRHLVNKFPMAIKESFVFLFYPLIGLIIILVVSYLPQSQDLLSSESASIRLNQWFQQIEIFRHLPIAEQVFGSGIYQAQYDQKPIIDNMYLAVFLNLGYYGLVCWILMLSVYISILRSFVVGYEKYLLEIIIGLWLFAMVNNLSIGIFESLLFLSATVVFKHKDIEYGKF
ncbi:O-antigen ligase family protein [Deinococcus radiopugnans]|uniref:O-antigen ligase family protein n=1 Tax=Deinococcus radiopugnans TaxID=57497 RepID=UPI0012E03A8A|nr:O-antigen ligase family protein [Deinococcus radiopugnans]